MQLEEKIQPFEFDPEPFLKRRWTYDELLLEMPESNTHIELWDGQLFIGG